MSILKKTIAGALTIALSVGAIGTSAMPVLAASENNIDVLQKNVGLHFFLGDGFFARGIDRNLIRVKK